MTFIRAIAINFKKYATFTGRASRSEFWYFFLFTLLVGTVLQIVDAIIFPEVVVQPLYTIFVLLTVMPSYAVGARRLHDVGVSGWWQLIPLSGLGGGLCLYATDIDITVSLLWALFALFAVLMVIMFYFLAKRGAAEANRFGAAPYVGEPKTQTA